MGDWGPEFAAHRKELHGAASLAVLELEDDAQPVVKIVGRPVH